MACNGPTLLDTHIGRRLRKRRRELGKPMGWLADELMVSHQQIGKYEKGENRIPASYLYRLARLLNVPSDYFFEGFNKE